MIQQILHAVKIKAYNINNFGITFDVTLLNGFKNIMQISNVVIHTGTNNGKWISIIRIIISTKDTLGL